MRRNVFILLIFLCACGKSLPELEDVNAETWADDKNACKGKRTTMIPALNKQKDKLLSLSEMDIITLLGRPDENELYKRNQKFFYYYLRPSPSCSSKGDSTTARLVIRFNAVGLAKEVFIEQ